MSEHKKDPVMKDDYLWDGSGEPDPEVQKLENLLGRYRRLIKLRSKSRRRAAGASLRFGSRFNLLLSPLCF